MQFNEVEEKIISVPIYKNCFVYFLINYNEVVYVGQTHQGISRPFSHHDKVFDEIKILYCEPDELDLFENFYIQKYEPIYNRQINYAVSWSLYRVRNAIRQQTGISNYTVPKLKKLLNELKITPFKDKYTGKYFITFEEYKIVMGHFEEEQL